jgi:hypothetical protein
MTTDKSLDTRRGGHLNLNDAVCRASLDFAFHIAGRRGLDFVGIPWIEPRWLRDCFCARGVGSFFLPEKNPMADARIS